MIGSYHKSGHESYYKRMPPESPKRMRLVWWLLALLVVLGGGIVLAVSVGLAKTANDAAAHLHEPVASAEQRGGETE